MWRSTKSSPVFTKSLVILAEYKDAIFTNTVSQFDQMLNKDGYNTNGAKDCAAKYFADQFGVRPQFDVVGVAQLPKTRAYYGENVTTGGNDKYPGMMIAHACIAAHDDLKVDFSKYDEDGDGFVDRVFVFYAGEDESQQTVDIYGKRENEDFIWSHSGTLKGGDYGSYLELDGVKINLYACTSEIYRAYSGSSFSQVAAPIGTFCHETMHTFGVADEYDTDYAKSGGTAAGEWGSTALMDSGNNNSKGNYPPNLNAVEKEQLGLATIEDLAVGDYVMTPINSQDAKVYRLSNPTDPTDYFLFECRDTSGWDKYAGGSGMLVYHIDRSATRKQISDTYGFQMSAEQRWMYNEVNCRPGMLDEKGKAVQTLDNHQCCDLIEADGRCDVNPESSAFSNVKGVFFPQVGATSIGYGCDREIKFWDGLYPKLTVTNITIVGSNVSFAVKDITSPVPPEPTDTLSVQEPLYIIIKYSQPLEDSYFVKSGTNMYMRLSNSVGAKEVKWFFNKMEIPDPTQFKATVSGEIRVAVKWYDDTMDYLFKEIKVK